MPYSALNPNGDADFALRQRQAKMSDYVAMAQLAAQERMASMANDTQRYGVDKGAATQLGVAGIGKDTTLGAANINAASAGNVAGIGAKAQTDTAGIQTAPQMLRVGLERDEYTDKAPQRALANAQAGLATKRLAPQGRIADLIDSQVEQSLRGGAPSPGAVPGAAPAAQPILRPQDVRGLVRGYAGLAPDPGEGMIQNFLLQRMQDDPENAQAYIAAASTGDISKIPKERGSLDAKKAQEYDTAKRMVDPDIQAVVKEIRANNWRIGDADQTRIQALADGVMNKLRQLRVSPETQAMIGDELKKNMEGALHENGVFFESSGSDMARARNGLAR
jgi:hypothetical protein